MHKIKQKQNAPKHSQNDCMQAKMLDDICALIKWLLLTAVLCISELSYTTLKAKPQYTYSELSCILAETLYSRFGNTHWISSNFLQKILHMLLHSKDVCFSLSLVYLLEIHVMPNNKSQLHKFVIEIEKTSYPNKSGTNSVEDVISGIDPSSGTSPAPSWATNSCRTQADREIKIPSHKQKNRSKSLRVQKHKEERSIYTQISRELKKFVTLTHSAEFSQAHPFCWAWIDK